MTSKHWLWQRDDSYTEFRDLRVRAGLKLMDVARALNLHDSTVGLWEHGQRPVPDFHVPAVARLFGITEDEARAQLLCGSPAKEPGPRRMVPVVEVKAQPVVDPADASAWKEPDAESRDATARYEVYAFREADAHQRARAFRRSMGRTRYFPAYESVQMGPSWRCRRGHVYCRSDHAFEVRATRSVERERRSA